MPNKQRKLRAIKEFAYKQRTLLVVIVFSLLAISITYVLYSYTQKLLQQRLQERIIAITSTSASLVNWHDVATVKSEEDLETPELKKLVALLKRVRDANKNIRYAYIMRRTADINTFSFVADAEMLNTFDELDLNKDGVIEEEEEAPLPGDPFDVSEYPVLRDEAFFQPSADDELHKDQWSVQLSAYAPIVDDDGNSIAILGVDVIVDDFLRLTQATLLPFLLFILFLILALTLLTLLVVRFWRERADALQELDRQKDELLSIVSHQLATPVTSIKWYLELMLGGDVGKLQDEQMKYLESMQSISADLADLVSMILDVSRIQLGRMKVDRQPLDLNDFFGEVLTVIRPKAEEKKQELTEDVAKQLPTAMLDKRLMRMTVENLLSNAVKYTPDKGKVTLHVEVRDKKLYCEIRDTGVGIPKQEQSRMFERLYRASNVRNTIDGNGFGLYVAKGAVESQDGRIWFESTEGKGTIFFIEWPLVAAPKADTEKKAPTKK